MKTNLPPTLLAVFATLPGTWIAARPATIWDSLLLTTGVVGLGSLAVLSERWRSRHRGSSHER